VGMKPCTPSCIKHFASCEKNGSPYTDPKIGAILFLRCARRLSALFRRLIALLLAPQPTLDGLRVFKLAHVVTLLLRGVPGGAAHVREEFEEEIR
jgi:hypothetical protein